MHASQTALSFQSFDPSSSSQAKTAISSFSLVWSRGINHENETSVLDNTLEMGGVISARYTCNAPYILLISYNPEITDPTDITETYFNYMEPDSIDFVQRW